MDETDPGRTRGAATTPDPAGGGLPVSQPGRYTKLRLIGWGGMGEVWLAEDHLLEREVALKTLHARALAEAESERRFLGEAQLQARLQHPDIVPLYDVGRLYEDDRPFFTMRVVAGRSMRDACAGPALDGPELRRRVEVLRRVAEAIAFAHREGLLHRDLKPGNIMLGESGEVTVVDWGIGQNLKPEGSGSSAGTPPYIAPEAETGARPDERVDVYGLGATLLHALLGATPDPARALAAQIPERAPEDLAALIRASTDPDPALRLADASTFAQLAQSWLDGAREQERALALVAEAQERRQQMQARAAQAASLTAEARALAATLRPWAPIEEKRPVWALEAKAEALTDQANLDEVAVLETLAAALRRAPDLREAREALADVHQARHAQAEAAGDARAAAQAELLLRAADTGRHARWLSGEGSLTLITDPPGALVRLHRYVEQDRRLVPVFEQELGPTPLLERPLDRGSWLLTLHAPGRAVVRYPVAIGRNERWGGVPPGGAEPLPILLPPEEALGPDDVYIPAGWSWVGGDPRAPRSLPRQRVWVDGFVMKRFPVTNGEYLAFLNDLVAQGREGEAERMIPGRIGGEPVFAFSADGRCVPFVDAQHFVYPMDWPVTLLDWHMAQAYTAWLAAQDGLGWRLPYELEWERAARSVEGRVYPWGAIYDGTFSRTSESAASPFPVPITDYAQDESAWGVRGLAGNALCWCRDRYRLEGPEALSEGRLYTGAADESDDSNRVIRGAGYTGTGLLARSATRHPYTPIHRSEIVGVRVVRAASEGRLPA